MQEKGYFRIGDRVVLGNNESRPLIVTGFAALYFGRLSGYRMPPGVYLNLRQVAVRTPDRIQLPGFQDHMELSHADPAVTLARRPRPTKHEMRVGDLPETALYEGDCVYHGSNVRFVTGIDYAPLALGEPPKYRIDSVLSPQPIDPSTNLYTYHELTLKSRGNAWRQENDDTTMSFENFPEEVKFHLMMGWFTKIDLRVRNIGDARNHTTRGNADGFFVVGSDIATTTVSAVNLTKATVELREAFRKTCLQAPPDFPAFRFS